MTPATRIRPTVLVVDDDPDLRDLAAIQLSEGFDVLQASDGRQCCELASRHSPDVILLDMLMPGMTGTEVVQHLNSDPATRNIPVIFLSSLAEPEDRAAGIECGAIDFITKPAQAVELTARVRAAAKRGAQMRAVTGGLGHDDLTSLPKKEDFLVRLRQELSRARRLSSPLSILIADVDQMATINATFGPDFGDTVLQSIARAFSETLRASDTVFRYGGDEFAAILSEAEAGTAAIAAERCRAAVTRLHPPARQIHISIGLAELSQGRSADELLARAEIALFRAKESGGNRTWRADDPRRHAVSPAALAADLTPREWLILLYLSEDQTETEIANKMGIRPGTVRSHKARIRRKLQVSQDVRLADFVDLHLRDLVARLEVPELEKADHEEVDA